MKKLILMILALTLFMNLAGCTQKGNEISKLVKQGYECTSTSADEKEYTAIYYKDGDPASYKGLQIPFTAELYEEYFTILNSDSENVDEDILEFLSNLEDITVTDLNDKVPSKEELDHYVGLTLGDLEDEGFGNSGNSNLDGVYVFDFENEKYYLTVELKEGTIIDDLDALSEEEYRALEIGKVNFVYFRDGILAD